MILQTDLILNSLSDFSYGDSGCALFVLIDIAVKKQKYVFERESFIHDCEDWFNRELIDKECTILSWDGMLSALNLPYKIVIEGGTHKLLRHPHENEIQILYLKHLERGYKHFVGADNRDNVTYDPLGESNTAKAYYERKGIIIGRRILREIV